MRKPFTTSVVFIALCAGMTLGKWGVGLSRVMAIDLADFGIRVNVPAPGIVVDGGFSATGLSAISSEGATIPLGSDDLV